MMIKLVCFPAGLATGRGRLKAILDCLLGTESWGIMASLATTGQSIELALRGLFCSDICSSGWKGGSHKCSLPLKAEKEQRTTLLGELADNWIILSAGYCSFWQKAFSAHCKSNETPIQNLEDFSIQLSVCCTWFFSVICIRHNSQSTRYVLHPKLRVISWQGTTPEGYEHVY